MTALRLNLGPEKEIPMSKQNVPTMESIARELLEYGAEGTMDFDMDTARVQFQNKLRAEQRNRASI